MLEVKIAPGRCLWVPFFHRFVVRRDPSSISEGLNIGGIGNLCQLE